MTAKAKKPAAGQRRGEVDGRPLPPFGGGIPTPEEWDRICERLWPKSGLAVGATTGTGGGSPSGGRGRGSK